MRGDKLDSNYSKELKSKMRLDAVVTTLAVLASTFANAAVALQTDDGLLLNSLVSRHVANGQEVIPHSLPHQVALYKDNLYFFCGGSLISDQWVLTAGHCAVDSFRKTAVVGLHNTEHREPTAIAVPVRTTIVHEKYTPSDLRYDIALMKLERSVRIDGEYVNTIRLPRVSQKSSTFLWSEAIISGWGALVDRNSKPSPVLRSVRARVLWGPYCKAYFWTSDSLFNTKNQMCTSGSGKKGGCYGDSGGPLTLEESDGQMTVIGIASFIYTDNCDSGGPTAFLRVTEFLDWINLHTGIPLRP